MKFSKYILSALAVLGMVASVTAQDTFSATRTAVIAPNTVIATAASVTNGPFDRALFIGTGKIDILANIGSGDGLTATIYGSPDQTNLTAISNFALVSGATTISSTNYYYGTNGLTAKNSILLPGTSTTPTAATAGFSTAYINPLPFTNTGAITLTTITNVSVGIRLIDQPRYLYIITTMTGTNPSSYSAVLTAPTISLPN